MQADVYALVDALRRIEGAATDVPAASIEAAYKALAEIADTCATVLATSVLAEEVEQYDAFVREGGH